MGGRKIAITRRYGGGVLSTRPMVGGYKRSQFYDGSRTEAVIVHRVVCTAFHGPAPKDGMHVRHLDGNPKNNSAENLAWGTVAENAADRKAHGTQPLGEKHHYAIFTDAQAKDIKALALAGVSSSKIANMFGCCRATVRNIATGRRYSNVSAG